MVAWLFLYFVVRSLCLRCLLIFSNAIHLGHKSKGGLQYGHV
nr:MAG TPA: hypothetical protein [Caudoviricetes sp.]